MKTRKLLAGLLFAAAITGSSSVFAQVKIGGNPTSIDPSAVLDLESTNKGFLPPRVSLTSVTDATTILAPATGLVVYNTNTGLTNGTGIYINSGTPASPLWGKLDANTTTTGGSVHKMSYLGPTDETKTVQAGSLQFRYRVVAPYFWIEARLAKVPSQRITVSGRRLGWDVGSNTFVVNTYWDPADFDQWKRIDIMSSEASNLIFLNVTGETTFYRLSGTATTNQFNSLLVETF